MLKVFYKKKNTLKKLKNVTLRKRKFCYYLKYDPFVEININDMRNYIIQEIIYLYKATHFQR